MEDNMSQESNNVGKESSPILPQSLELTVKGDEGVVKCGKFEGNFDIYEGPGPEIFEGLAAELGLEFKFESIA
jgi:hypothetical protein